MFTILLVLRMCASSFTDLVVRSEREFELHMKPNFFLHSCKIYRLKCTIPKFEIARTKLTILQALTVGQFCPEKWSEDWIEFVAKFLGCDVILVTELLFTLTDFMSRRRIFRRKPCPVIRKWVIYD